MPKNTNITQIRSRLADRNLAAVARKTGIHVNTIRAIASGKNKTPKLETLMKIKKYLDRRP